ncbi:hypothetical protein MK489_13830 [Myxococcota bacterium]|nr:hypothetical protein [Myxococcota bacterium]
MAELFPTRIRSSAIGIAYNLSMGVLGGTSPLVSTWLISQTRDIAAPAYCLIFLSLVTFAALCTLHVRDGGKLA